MRIDCHVHLTPPDIIKNWKSLSDEEPYFDLLSNSSVNRFSDAEGIIEYLDKNNLDKAVIFGFAFEKGHNLRAANEYVIESVQKYPDRFIGFGVVNPLQKDIQDEINYCLDNGLVGFGELFPTGQKFDITDADLLKPLTDACTERGFPILIHANEPIGHYYPGKTNTTLNELLTFAENFPEQKVIYAHFGGGLLYYEFMPEIKKILTNSYYDTAASPYLYDPSVYNAIEAMGLSDKMIFGSDFPLPCAVQTIDQIESSTLSSDSLNKIMGDNLEKLLMKR